MAKRLICDRLVDVGMFPYNVKAIGFKDADEVSRVAHKFGNVVTPMNYDDVIELFESEDHK